MRLTFLLLLLILLSSCAHIKADRDEEKVFRYLWIKERDITAPITGNLPIGLNSPYIYENYLYAGHNDGYMAAYNLEDGRERWRAEDQSEYHSSPVIFNDQIVYGTVEGRVYSRHYLTGEMKYVIDLGSPVESEGVLYKGRVFFHLRNHQIFCLDALTGKILWAYKRSVPYPTTLQRVSVPLVISDKLYVGFADGYVASFSIDDGVLLWENKVVTSSKFVDIDSTPVFKDGKLFIASISGPLVILDAQAGTLLRTLDYVATRSPILKGDSILFGTTDGMVVMLDRFFKEQKKIKVSKDSITSLVEWKNGFVVTTVGQNVYYIDGQTLEVKEVFKLGHSYSAVFGRPSILGDKLAFISSRNRLYVFY